MRAIATVSLVVLSAHVLAQPQTAWVDPSRHGRCTVQVEPGTSLEVLDWGGAHRVLGITRRGHGDAGMPPEAARLSG